LKTEYIPVNIPLITEQDREAVNQALIDGWVSGEGPVVQEFESVVSSQVGRKYGVAVSNGSDAIELAIRVLDLSPGDEVILPSFTIISCLAPILRAGLVPVFLDADAETWNMRTDLLQDALSKKTKAILVVHIYGIATDMTQVMQFASQHNLRVIEDSAEAHGVYFRDQPCGSFGDLSTFSFYANKNVTTGEGGMVLTDDSRLAAKLRYFRNLTFQESRRFVHEDLGWNMRLSSLQAALGTSQAKRVVKSLARRRFIADRYRQALHGVEGIKFQADEFQGTRNGYWVFGVLLDSHHRFQNAEAAMAAFTHAGVGTRPFFHPLHQQPLIAQYPHRTVGKNPVSEDLGANGFYLPNGLGMSDSDLDRAVSLAHDVLD
jgi:perosamine synthetase